MRRAVQGLEATGLHAVFKALWGKSAGNPTKVREFIQSSTIRYPSDDEFIDNVQQNKLYGRRLCHYILAEYERDIRKGGDRLSEEQYASFTVDHVAPQSLRGSWAEVFSEVEDLALIQTWGNLVPLSSEANSTKNSTGWAAAQELLKHDTIFKTTMQIYSNHVRWAPDEVRARNHALADWAVKHWPSFT